VQYQHEGCPSVRPSWHGALSTEIFRVDSLLWYFARGLAGCQVNTLGTARAGADARPPWSESSNGLATVQRTDRGHRQNLRRIRYRCLRHEISQDRGSKTWDKPRHERLHWDVLKCLRHDETRQTRDTAKTRHTSVETEPRPRHEMSRDSLQTRHVSPDSITNSKVGSSRSTVHSRQ